MGSHDPFGHLTHKLWPKEGRKSNWQFDSRPLKVRNHPDFLACRWRSIYRWKTLDEGYNFSLDLISIRGLHTKLWVPKVMGVLIVRISGLPLGSPETKGHLGAGHMAMHRVYYKGEDGGFPQVRTMVSLVNPNLPMARPSTKVFRLCINQLVIWFVQVHVSEWLLVILPNPISKLQHTPLPSKCHEPKSMPQLLTFSMFHLKFTFESIKELGCGSFSLNDFNQSLFLLCVQ
jgi:hypothetical protein